MPHLVALFLYLLLLLSLFFEKKEKRDRQRDPPPPPFRGYLLSSVVPGQEDGLRVTGSYSY